MTVELILSKLVELLEQKAIPPVFLLSEEAHLYLRDTYWEDLITRMRHFGVFTTFVTNQPDAIKQEIYRQADNIFLYNFSNEADLNLVSPGLDGRHRHGEVDSQDPAAPDVPGPRPRGQQPACAWSPSTSSTPLPAG